eukprot:3958084-Pyramimonas_sp.AAC.1
MGALRGRGHLGHEARRARHRCQPTAFPPRVDQAEHGVRSGLRRGIGGRGCLNDAVRKFPVGKRRGASFLAKVKPVQAVTEPLP